MLTMDNSSLIRAWQACFKPEAGWRQESIPGLAPILWCAEDNGACTYLTPSCGSTMDLARSLADGGRFPEMSWAAAVTQTTGRGQLGRKWETAAGNLCATIRLPDQAAGAGTLLPLTIGLLIADELKNHVPAPQIKWPNDILMGTKKTGGILVEERQGMIMAGVGLNVEVVPSMDHHVEDYRIPACSLKEFGCRADAPALWRAIADRLNTDLMHLLSAPDDLKDRMTQVLAFSGDSVIHENGTGEGRLVKISGIDTAGGLIVETPEGTRTIYSGQINPRITI